MYHVCMYACAYVCMYVHMYVLQVLGLAILILGIVALINARSEGLGFHTAFAGGAGVCIASGTITVIVSIAGNIGVLFKLRPFLITVGSIHDTVKPLIRDAMNWGLIFLDP